MIVASPVLSLNDRTIPRWQTVVPSTDHHKVCSNIPLYVFSRCPPTDTCKGPSFLRWSVLHNRSGCQRPFFKGLLLFLSVFWRTSTMDHYTLEVPYCSTVMTVRDPFPMGLHDRNWRWTVIVTMSCLAYPIILVRNILSGVSTST